VYSQINKLNKIGLFCCNVRLSTSEFEFSPACWSAAEIPIHRGRSETKIPFLTESERSGNPISTGQFGMNYLKHSSIKLLKNSH